MALNVFRLLIASGVAMLMLLPPVGRAREQVPAAAAEARSFGALVASLSEPGGYFDTDNLISNERSYLHVVPTLRTLAGQTGGSSVYIGVGPDQNFSYIAHLRPARAILIDIRRDNLLLHLLFKSLFAEAATRADYLALLTARDLKPAGGDEPIEALVRRVDAAKRRTPEDTARLQARLGQRDRRIRRPALGGRPRDDRAVPSAVHRRRSVAAVQFRGPPAAV